MKTGILIAQRPGPGLPFVVLDRPALTVGRGAHCDLVVDHASVSRRHAQLQRRGDTWRVTDEQSRNGTTVNGVSVVTQRLRDQDRLMFGDVAFTFVEGEPPSEVATPGPVARRSAGREETMPQARAPAATADAGAAWQAVRFAAFHPGITATAWVEDLVAGLAGLASVLHVLVFLPRGTLGDGETFIRSAGLEGRPFAEETLRAVAADGAGQVVCAGRRVPARAAAGAVEAVYAPIPRPGQRGGCLYVEADGTFNPGLADVISAQADALAIGLRLLAGGPAPAAPEPPASAGDGIVGRSRALLDTIRMARKAAASEVPVLVSGETGTGKELLSRLLWRESARAEGPFLAVQLGAIPPKLVADALFGHEKGAFSDAVAARKGYFEEADGGTIFLDEIGDIPLDVQISMLRLLQEKEVLRLGGNKPKRVDVRVIAATNRNLARAVQDGAFREDLYYRLKVIELVAPPLRERKEDIPDLVRAFMAQARRGSASRIERIADDALAALTSYRWPGNIRELRNVIERAMVLGEGEVLTVDDLPADVRGGGPAASTSGPVAAGAAPDGPHSLEEVERRHIRAAVERCGGNLAEAARQLGISRSTLYAKLEESRKAAAPGA